MGDMQDIKKHFEEEAREFDDNIKKLIPYYNQMVGAVVNSLPFGNTDGIEVIDLGCGTGTVAKAVKGAFPKAELTCVDIAENMLEMAKVKLIEAQDTTYINSDFYKFSFDMQYDAVVSSLALHHMVTKEDKLDFYKKVHGGLKDGGVLVNADVVLASNDNLQSCYMEQWKNYMLRSVSLEEVEKKWIPSYHKEDRPISLVEHFELLKEAGFTTVDVVWKYYNFAVYTAVK